MLTMLPSLCLISSKQTVSSSQCLCCWPLGLGLKVIVAQDKTPKRGCRLPVVNNPHTSRLTCCPPHDWSSTARVVHQGHRSWGWGGSDPMKVCWVGQSMFCPPKMLHSFIQNCCITASFTASKMNSWTLALHWSCICWRCYHPYDIWSAPSRQCPPINAFAAILGLKLSWPKTKLQNVGAGDPPSTMTY